MTRRIARSTPRPSAPGARFPTAAVAAFLAAGGGTRRSARAPALPPLATDDRDVVIAWLLAMAHRPEVVAAQVGVLAALLATGPVVSAPVTHALLTAYEGTVWAARDIQRVLLRCPALSPAALAAYLDRAPAGREFAAPWHPRFTAVTKNPRALADTRVRAVLARHPGQYAIRALIRASPPAERLPHVLRLLALFRASDESRRGPGGVGPAGRAVPVLSLLRELAANGPLATQVPGLTAEHLLVALATGSPQDRADAVVLLGRF